MAVTILRQTDQDPVGELTPYSFSTVVIVPNGVGGPRFPTAVELTGAACKLTVTHVDDGTVINGLSAVALLPTHGAYVEATGLLTVNLVAADNPMVAGGGTEEQSHRALIYAPGLFWVEVLFTVQAATAGVP